MTVNQIFDKFKLETFQSDRELKTDEEILECIEVCVKLVTNWWKDLKDEEVDI